MTDAVVVAVLAGAVVSLLVAVRGGERHLEVLSKAVASGAFVGLGLFRWSAGTGFESWILAGLVLCALGDLLLLGGRSFDLGLAAFLLGHVAYAVAFSRALSPSEWSLPAVGPLALAGVAAAVWLWPHLGRRRIPVAAYIVAITVMVWGGVSAAIASAVSWTAAAGVILFYLSDLAVARHRFVRAEFINRGVGLPLYYAGQVLIALAV